MAHIQIIIYTLGKKNDEEKTEKAGISRFFLL